MFIRFVICMLNTGILTVAQVTGDADCIDSYPSNWTGLYGGRKNTTVTGKICKLWSDTNHNTYGQSNYCRAPVGDLESPKGPWCYLQDEKGWEFCFIPLCNTDCRKSLTDRNYNGTMNVTKSGHRCRKWSLNTPLPAGEPPSAYHGETLNYCRTPDGDTETKPWCYTTSQDARWEVCNVPFCDDIKSTLCPDLIGSDFLVEPMILTGYRFDSVVTFTCTNGYTIEGPTSIKCTVDARKTFKGHWNSTQPTCVGIRCPLITLDHSDVLNRSIRFPETIQVKCNSGYQLNGSSSIECTQSGNWIPLPTCDGKIHDKHYYFACIRIITEASVFSVLEIKHLTCQNMFSIGTILNVGMEKNN